MSLCSLIICTSRMLSAQIEQARDGRPPQVVRREVAQTRVVGVLLDNLADHSRRQRLVVDECARVGVWLKQPIARAASVENLPPLAIQLKAFVNRAFHTRRERQCPFPSPLTLNLIMGRP